MHFPHEVEIGGDSNGSLEKGTAWGKSSLNDLEQFRLISPTLILPTNDQFVSFRLLNIAIM